MTHQTDIVEFLGAEDNRLVADRHVPVEGAEHGLPVLLLHGGGQTRHAWGNAARRIAEAGHRAYTVDQRGHGDSAWVPTQAYATMDYAADAVALARQIADETGSSPVLVGASLGALPLGIAFDLFSSYDATLRWLAVQPALCIGLAFFLRLPALLERRAAGEQG